MELELLLQQMPALGLNGAGVFLLYRLHRDVKEVSGRLEVEVSRLRDDLEVQLSWIERINRKLWPQVFEVRQSCD